MGEPPIYHPSMEKDQEGIPDVRCLMYSISLSYIIVCRRKIARWKRELSTRRESALRLLQEGALTVEEVRPIEKLSEKVCHLVRYQVLSEQEEVPLTLGGRPPYRRVRFDESSFQRQSKGKHRRLRHIGGLKKEDWVLLEIGSVKLDRVFENGDANPGC